MIKNQNVICNDCGFGKQNKELAETNEALKAELKQVCDVLIRKCPEMKEWVMLNWKNLYEVDND
jgi:hypothetical protein